MICEFVIGKKPFTTEINKARNEMSVGVTRYSGSLKGVWRAKRYWEKIIGPDSLPPYWDTELFLFCILL